MKLKIIFWHILFLMVILTCFSFFRLIQDRQQYEMDKQQYEIWREEIQKSREFREKMDKIIEKLHIELDTTVSYYAPYDNRSGICRDGDILTATGTMPGPGTFAVNPDVIPYGSRVAIIYQDGTIEHGRALDTGGAIRASRSRIDVFRQTHEAAMRDGLKKAVVVHGKW